MGYTCRICNKYLTWTHFQKQFRVKYGRWIDFSCNECWNELSDTEKQDMISEMDKEYEYEISEWDKRLEKNRIIEEQEQKRKIEIAEMIASCVVDKWL